MGTNEASLCEIQMTINEVRKIMEERDVKKASGPDGVSKWIIRECSQQLADKIQSHHEFIGRGQGSNRLEES